MYDANYNNTTMFSARVGLVTRSAFTISEVAADWHELMIPQRIVRPSIAGRQWIRGAACKHTTALVGDTQACTL